MLVMGLNNYSQMGIDHTKSGLTFFMPVVSDDLSSRDWQHIAIGQHHTLGLETSGKVHCIGRADYGRLGLGEGASDIGKVNIDMSLRIPLDSTHLRLIRINEFINRAILKE